MLFVDDDPRVLEGLRRMLRSTRDEWDTEFAASGEAALLALAARGFDAIVSDIRMPGMPGAELLYVVREQYPAMARLALSGECNAQLGDRWIEPAHEFLSKPCDPDTLKLAVRRSIALRRFLTAADVQRAVQQLQPLPVVPCWYWSCRTAVPSDHSWRLLRESFASEPSALERLLAAAKALLRAPAPTVDLADAIDELGPPAVANLALAVDWYQQHQGVTLPCMALNQLQDHCLQTGLAARRHALQHGAAREAADDALLAGLLHAAALPLCAARLPELMPSLAAKAREPGGSLVAAEIEVLGADHARLSAVLADAWRLPQPVVKALAYQFEPDRKVGSGFSPLTAVCLARAELPPLVPGAIEAGRLCMSYLSKAGVAVPTSAGLDSSDLPLQGACP